MPRFFVFLCVNLYFFPIPARLSAPTSIRNSKSEALNPKQIRMTKILKFKTKNGRGEREYLGYRVPDGWVDARSAFVVGVCVGLVVGRP